MTITRHPAFMWVVVAVLGGCQLPQSSQAQAPVAATPKRNLFTRLIHGTDKEEIREAIVRAPDGKIQTGAGASHPALAEVARAQELYAAGNYNRARNAYQWLAWKYAGTEIEEEALYYSGECAFKLEMYPSAQDAFARLLNKFPTTRYLPQAVQRSYDIAYFWLENDQKSTGESAQRNWTAFVNFFDKRKPLLQKEERAIEAINTIEQFDPAGPLTDDAVMMAGGYSFQEGNFLRAASYYERLAIDQPKSEFATRALVLGAEAYLRSYEGPNYDGQELDDAMRLTKMALARGQDLESDERDRLERRLRMMVLEKAKRDFAAGEQYQRQGRPEAAKFCFERVRDNPNYAGTDWARRAQEEITRIDVEAQKPITPWSRTVDYVLGRRRLGDPNNKNRPTGSRPADPNAMMQNVMPFGAAPQQ